MATNVKPGTKIYSKHTVSLGSALYFALVLTSGFVESKGTRNACLTWILPRQHTTMSVLYPILIISSNQNLKKHFKQSFTEICNCVLKYFRSNKIEYFVES